MPEYETSENKTIEEIIVNKLNLNAGIIEFVSTNKEIYPAGNFTLKWLKIVLLRKSVTPISNP